MLDWLSGFQGFYMVGAWIPGLFGDDAFFAWDLV